MKEVNLTNIDITHNAHPLILIQLTTFLLIESHISIKAYMLVAPLATDITCTQHGLILRCPLQSNMV